MFPTLEKNAETLLLSSLFQNCRFGQVRLIALLKFTIQLKISCLSIGQGVLLMFNYSCGSIYFSSQFYQFLCCVFWRTVMYMKFRIFTFLWIDLSMKRPSFWVIFFWNQCSYNRLIWMSLEGLSGLSFYFLPT